MNYFKEAESLIKNLPLLEISLDNLKARKGRIIQNNGPQDINGMDYSAPFISSHHVNDTLNELLEYSECLKEIKNTENKIGEITQVINQLDEKHKRIIELWYTEKIPKEKIMEKLNIESLTTVYNLRNTAIAEFALLYFGADALPSI